MPGIMFFDSATPRDVDLNTVGISPTPLGGIITKVGKLQLSRILEVSAAAAAAASSESELQGYLRHFLR